MPFVALATGKGAEVSQNADLAMTFTAPPVPRFGPTL
jgi:hypothetical protein